MSDVAAIERLVDTALGRGLGSAMAVSIGDGGREIYGLVRGRTQRVPEEGAPIDERTWFDVASLTKPMVTAACAMVLVGEGRCELDAPVRTWIPEAATPGTLRQLLGHAAGCVAHVEFFRGLAAECGDRPGDARRELVARAAAEPIGSAPGTAAVYSDLGYILAGAVIEQIVGAPLESVFATLVAEPLGLGARFVLAAEAALSGAVATEVDDMMGRALVSGRVHDENCYFGGGVCGHAGLFARIGDVAAFAAAIVDTAAGTPRGRFVPAVVREFLTSAAAPAASWRLGFDTPSEVPGVSHAGDRWPRSGSAGHLGFTGTSMWLDIPRRRWSVLLANRVHPTRHGTTAEEMKTLRRAVNDAAVALCDGDEMSRA